MVGLQPRHYRHERRGHTAPTTIATLVVAGLQPRRVANFGPAEAQPANAVGGGVLQSLVAVAVNYWEAAYGDPFTLNIEYGWFPRSGTTTGTHSLVSEGGTPHRETSGSLAFDSDQSTIWFIDPTPTSASEYTTFTNYTADLGGGTMPGMVGNRPAPRPRRGMAANRPRA